jgi:hypothetical protein
MPKTAEIGFKLMVNAGVQLCRVEEITARDLQWRA